MAFSACSRLTREMKEHGETADRFQEAFEDAQRSTMLKADW